MYITFTHALCAYCTYIYLCINTNFLKSGKMAKDNAQGKTTND